MRRWYDYAEGALKLAALAVVVVLSAVVVGWLLSKGLPALILV